MKKAGRPAFSTQATHWYYWAGAAGAFGSAGFMVPLVPGSAGAGVVAGGVDCVVVLSVPPEPPLPLSLQAATPNSAIAATDAKMSFFITSLLGFQAISGAVGTPRPKAQ
jgi:hypothetical protein